MAENEKPDGREAYLLALVDTVRSSNTKDTIVMIGFLIVIVMLVGVLAVLMGSLTV